MLSRTVRHRRRHHYSRDTIPRMRRVDGRPIEHIPHSNPPRLTIESISRDYDNCEAARAPELTGLRNTLGWWWYLFRNPRHPP